MVNLTEVVRSRRGILEGLTDAEKRHLTRTILQNPYIPQVPTRKQRDTLLLRVPELLYGGAAGGGKSSLLLMAALQHVHIYKTHSVIIRRTSKQLHKADALIPRAHEWLEGTDAVWREVKLTWTFPNGSTLEFGHMEHENDRYNYQGASYDFIGFDELTQFTESQYLYVIGSRAGRSMSVSPRMWSTSNPGGIGHDWVKRRFVTGDIMFVPALITDNPHISDKYIENLKLLDPVTRAQLERGDWDVMVQGNMFRRDSITYSLPPYRASGARAVRFWDVAATAPSQQNTDPDWTVGLKLLARNGEYWVMDVVRGQWDSSEVARIQHQTAELDGRGVLIYEEQEPGSSGKAVIDWKAREVFAGYPYRGVPSTGKKIDRARNVAAAMANGLVHLPPGAPWAEDFIFELVSFPDGMHDDQVDALSGAFNMLVLSGDPSRFTVGSVGKYGGV